MRRLKNRKVPFTMPKKFAPSAYVISDEAPQASYSGHKYDDAVDAAFANPGKVIKLQDTFKTESTARIIRRRHEGKPRPVGNDVNDGALYVLDTDAVKGEDGYYVIRLWVVRQSDAEAKHNAEIAAKVAADAAKQDADAAASALHATPTAAAPVEVQEGAADAAQAEKAFADNTSVALQGDINVGPVDAPKTGTRGKGRAVKDAPQA